MKKIVFALFWLLGAVVVSAQTVVPFTFVIPAEDNRKKVTPITANTGVEYYQVKAIASDGTVSSDYISSPSYVSISTGEVEITRFVVQSRDQYFVGGNYQTFKYKFSHYEDGNRVYYMVKIECDAKSDYKQVYSNSEIYKTAALVLSSDKATINLFWFKNAVTKELSSGLVYKKIVDDKIKIGGMYE